MPAKAKQRYDIVSIGTVVEDVFVRSSGIQVIQSPASETGQALCLPLGAKLEVETLKHQIGGGGANTAVAFRRLGLRSTALLRVGDDGSGHRVAEALEEEGVDPAHLMYDPLHDTGHSILLLAPNGNRTSLPYRGASAHFKVSEVREELLQRTEWVYLSSIGGDVEVLTAIFALCKIHGVNIAWNPGSKELSHGQQALLPLLQQVDVLILNREEAAALTGMAHDTAERILERLIFFLSKGVVVVTNGAAGAVAYDGSTIDSLPGRDVLVVDTTGAGDAFGSGFVGAHILGAGMDKALSFALSNAESVIGQIGAQPGLLRRSAFDHQKLLRGIEKYRPTIDAHHRTVLAAAI